MTDDNDIRTGDGHRFGYLLAALCVLLLGYPYLRDDASGAFLGGLLSLALLVTGVYAVSRNRIYFGIATGLAVLAALTSALAFSSGRRGDPLVEGAFTLFYGFTTVSIFLDVMKSRHVGRDTIIGTVCVYLLIGVTFGTLYDLIETLQPGSFRLVSGAVAEGSPGWRQLIYFSFVTLTTVGYGDMIPATAQVQSLSFVEGIIGVLFVAVLIARIVGTYSRDSGADRGASDRE